MDLKLLKLNAEALRRDLEWLSVVIDTRVRLYFNQDSQYQDVSEIAAPDLGGDESMYAQILRRYEMDQPSRFAERVILLLALAPHVRPQLLDVFFLRNSAYDRGFTEFGGIKGVNHVGFIPSGETAAFILAADQLENRFQLLHIFSEDHFFKKDNILSLTHSQTPETFLSGALTISAEYFDYFTQGKSDKPSYNSSFPAKLLTTSLNWEDLVLEENVKNEVVEIQNWVSFRDTLMEPNISKKIKPGFRALFYGPSGTGKTLTASLLGKTTGLEVYRIDLSMLSSKYIGETEKNLSAIFDKAESKNWILFFDEADALFGKRTQVGSSHDRYANQEMAYLLQRIEDYPGVVIFSMNTEANINAALRNRFQSMIYFPMPKEEQRFRLWQQFLSPKIQLDEQVDLKEIAAKYELAGAEIANVMRYCVVKALKRGNNIILDEDILSGIRRELDKDNEPPSRFEKPRSNFV